MGAPVTEAHGNWTGETAGAPHDAPSALWSWDYLIKCFADEKVCVSFGLWALASLLWITSHSLLFYVRYKRKSRHEESAFCNIYSFFGSMCNTIGALLSKQLTIQIFTGGYMAAIDVINFVLTLFPVCGAKLRRRSGRHHYRGKRKYRTSLFAVFLSFVAGTGGYMMAVGVQPSLEDYHGPQRRLLGTFLQENTEIIGFTLGMAAVLVSWTFRGPVIAKVCKGKTFSAMQLWATFFSVMASLLYAAAIMAHNRQPEYFVRATPWFLISLGSAALDVAIIFLSCLMKSKISRKMGLVVETFETPDLQALLAREEEEAEEENELEEQRQRKGEKSTNWTPLNMFPSTRSHQQVSEIGRYMDLSIEPVQQWDFEDLDHQWNGDNVDMSNIEPHDSSVLNVSTREDSDAAPQLPPNS